MDKTISNDVSFQLAGATITIPEATIVELWLARADLAHQEPPALAPGGHPRIGDTMADGAIYMGVVRGDNGAPDHLLFDLGEAPNRMPWAEAVKWAEERDGRLPTRREQAVMFGNRATGQYQEAWYWSGEQYAGLESYAWMQGFYDGLQYDVHKSNDYHARAVRSEPIQ